MLNEPEPSRVSDVQRMRVHRIGNCRFVNPALPEHAGSQRGDALSREPRLFITRACCIKTLIISRRRPYPQLMINIGWGAWRWRVSKIAGMLPQLPITAG
jgi:hypothetical protein